MERSIDVGRLPREEGRDELGVLSSDIFDNSQLYGKILMFVRSSGVGGC